MPASPARSRGTSGNWLFRNAPAGRQASNSVRNSDRIVATTALARPASAASPSTARNRSVPAPEDRVNTSSNWSTTTSRLWRDPGAASRSSAATPAKSSVTCRDNSPRSIRRSGRSTRHACPTATARSRSGSRPGDIGGRASQPSTTSRGIRPARTSDDFPLPDAPTTTIAFAARWAVSDRTSDASRSISAPRPKKTGASAVSNETRPGNTGRPGFQAAPPPASRTARRARNSARAAAGSVR